MRNKLILPLFISTLCCSPLAASANSICDTKLFQQMIATEKKGIKRPSLKPSKALAKIMDEDEVLCPMQIERDFNGDKRNDWAGIIEQNGSFYLAAYLSGKTKYRLLRIKQYSRIPNNQYLDVVTEKRLAFTSGPIPFVSGVKFALVENTIGGNSTAYGWNGTLMKKLAQFNVKHRE